MYIHSINHITIPNNKHMTTHSKEIIDYLVKEKVITTSEVAKLLSISWNTAEKILTELFIEKKVIRVRKEGVNLWLLKR